MASTQFEILTERHSFDLAGSDRRPACHQHTYDIGVHVPNDALKFSRVHREKEWTQNGALGHSACRRGRGRYYFTINDREGTIG